MEPFPAALHAARLGCLTEQPSYQALESGWRWGMWPLPTAERVVPRPDFCAV